jgi:hypothetical protein
VRGREKRKEEKEERREGEERNRREDKVILVSGAHSCHSSINPFTRAEP